MGGWITMPTFWSCGLRPRPSAGGKPSRSKGLAANSITLTKNATTADVTPATYGIRSLKRRGVRSCATLAKRDSTTAQNRSDPFWPAQNAEKMYAEGRLLEV